MADKNELKYIIPHDFDYQTTRELFKLPNVSPEYPVFQIQPPKEQELTAFLIEEKQFDENRVKSVLVRLEKYKKTKP